MKIVKSRNRFLGIALWSGGSTILLLWLVIRRAGFSTTYSRCTYLAISGEYKQILEPGTSPVSNYLPPHLRLDQLSYLDLPQTELALPPVIDVAISEREQVEATEGAMPEHKRTDYEFRFGPIHSKSTVMSPEAAERYVHRRLGASPEDRKAVEEAEAAAASTGAGERRR